MLIKKHGKCMENYLSESKVGILFYRMIVH